uniref:Uncharacterized protein n=1 Tax=Rhizophora mucronata TaxID=61149 RepID=A0A2P2KLE5_RHIMU
MFKRENKAKIDISIGDTVIMSKYVLSLLIALILNRMVSSFSIHAKHTSQMTNCSFAEANDAPTCTKFSSNVSSQKHFISQ